MEKLKDILKNYSKKEKAIYLMGYLHALKDLDQSPRKKIREELLEKVRKDKQENTKEQKQ